MLHFKCAWGRRTRSGRRRIEAAIAAAQLLQMAKTRQKYVKGAFNNYMNMKREVKGQ